MRLGSILVGNVERIAATLLRDFQIELASGDRMGSAQMLVLYDPLDTDIIQPGDAVEIFQSAESSTSGAAGLYGSTLFGDTLFGEDGAGIRIFAGNVVKCDPVMMVARRTVAGATTLFGEPEFGGPLFGEAPGVEGINMMRIECRDKNYLAESTVIDTTVVYSSQTDQAIILAVFAAYLPSISTTNVSSTATLTTFEVTEGESVRSVLQKLQEKTGAIYYIDAEAQLYWFLPSARPAPFELGEEPDLATIFPFERETFRYSMEWRNPANSVKVKGGVTTGGVRYSGTASDATSISTYGTLEVTIVDAQIKSNAEAAAKAAVVLAERKDPQIGGELVTYVDGLDVGDYLTLDASTTLNLSGQFTIRRISMRWLNPTTTRYAIEWGSYQPDLARTVRALYDLSRTSAAVQPTTPAPETVTGGSGGSIVTGTITQGNMAAASIGTAQIIDANITTAKIGDAQITNAKIYDLDAVKITTGDLLVGGSGKIGQVTIYDGSNTAFGFIGKNGSDYGAWFAQMRAGGSGWSTARLRVANSGAITCQFVDGDDITLTSSSNSREVNLSNIGVKVTSSSNSGNYSQVREDLVSSQNVASGSANLISSGSGTRVSVTDFSNILALDSDSSGERITWSIGPTIWAGSGSPESVVTAGVGSLFLRLDGGAGTSLYVKQSGSGNTGWVGK